MAKIRIAEEKQKDLQIFFVYDTLYSHDGEKRRVTLKRFQDGKA